MDEFTRHCAELLGPLGSVRTKRMFGAVGVYVDEIFIAVIDQDTLYLKTDELTLPRFQAEGCGPFCFEGRDGESVVTSYSSPPEEALESPALMLPWARLAMEAALRKRNAKPARKKPAAKKSPVKPRS